MSNLKKYKYLFVISILTIVVLSGVHDLSKAPQKQCITHQSIVLIEWYQKHISKELFFIHCRYEVSCSEYSKRAIKEKGILKGGILSFKRISSCK